MLDGNFRAPIEKMVAPVGQGLRRAGITADMITATGLVMSLGAGVAIATGHLALGLLFIALTGIPDLLDGAVAKAGGTPGPRGAFFDSVSDRFTDAVMFGSVAWYFTTTSDGPLPMLPFAVFASASLVSYIRAKADALGLDARGGLIERAERIILLGIGLLFSPLLVGILWLLLALNLITAGQRFVKVWRQASSPQPESPTTRMRRRSRANSPATERRKARRAAMAERSRRNS